MSYYDQMLRSALWWLGLGRAQVPIVPVRAAPNRTLRSVGAADGSSDGAPAVSDGLRADPQSGMVGEGKEVEEAAPRAAALVGGVTGAGVSRGVELFPPVPPAPATADIEDLLLDFDISDLYSPAVQRAPSTEADGVVSGEGTSGGDAPLAAAAMSGRGPGRAPLMFPSVPLSSAALSGAPRLGQVVGKSIETPMLRDWTAASISAFLPKLRRFWEAERDNRMIELTNLHHLIDPALLRSKADFLRLYRDVALRAGERTFELSVRAAEEQQAFIQSRMGTSPRVLLMLRSGQSVGEELVPQILAELRETDEYQLLRTMYQVVYGHNSVQDEALNLEEYKRKVKRDLRWVHHDSYLESLLAFRRLYTETLLKHGAGYVFTQLEKGRRDAVYVVLDALEPEFFRLQLRAWVQAMRVQRVEMLWERLENPQYGEIVYVTARKMSAQSAAGGGSRFGGGGSRAGGGTSGTVSAVVVSGGASGGSSGSSAKPSTGQCFECGARDHLKIHCVGWKRRIERIKASGRMPTSEELRGKMQPKYKPGGAGSSRGGAVVAKGTVKEVVLSAQAPEFVSAAVSGVKPSAVMAVTNASAKPSSGGTVKAVVVKVLLSSASEVSEPDGWVMFGGLGVQTVLDTGARGGTVVALQTAEQIRQCMGLERVPVDNHVVQTATAGGNGSLRVPYKLVIPAGVRFHRDNGRVGVLPEWELFAVDGLDDSCLLLSREVCDALGFSVQEFLESFCVQTASGDESDIVAESAGSSVPLPTRKYERHVVKRVTVSRVNRAASVMESVGSGTVSMSVGPVGEPVAAAASVGVSSGAASQQYHLIEEVLPLDVGDDEDPTEPDCLPPEKAESGHDRTHMMECVEAELRECLAQGLPAEACEVIRAAFRDKPERLDVFAYGFSPGEHVGEPVTMEIKDPSFTTSITVPRLSREEREAVDKYFADLVAAGFAERVDWAQVASMAFVVAKGGVPASAPIEKRYRLVIGLRDVNGNIVFRQYAIASLDSLVDRLSGKRFVGKLDANHCFYQMLVHPDFRKWFTVMTPSGLFVVNRVLHGFLNAPGEWGCRFRKVLEPVQDCNVPYVDDDAVFGDTAMELAVNWVRTIDALLAGHVKVHPLKVQFYRRELEWCGRVFVEGGWRFNRKFIEKLQLMPLPVNAGQLMQWTMAAEWIRASIPKFSLMLKPFQDVVTTAGRIVKSRKKQKLKVVQLTDTVGWSEELKEKYHRVNEAFASSATLSTPKDGFELIVVTDACEKGWAGLVFQAPVSQSHLPIWKRDNELILCLSGSFDEREQKWITAEQEGYAVYATCKAADFILRVSAGFLMAVDNNNVAKMFTADKRLSYKMVRWRAYIQTLRCRLMHVAGETHDFPDLMSRWGLFDAVVESFQKPQKLFVRAVQTRAQLRKPVDGAASSVFAGAAGAGEPSVKSDGVSESESDSDVDSDVEVPSVGLAKAKLLRLPHAFEPDSITELSVADCPSEEEILRVQKLCVTPEVVEMYALQQKGEGTLWRGPTGGVFVPDGVNAMRLRERVTVVAHQGLSGHRGIERTVELVKSWFWWPMMDRDITRFVKLCLGCLKCRGGLIVPRPFGSLALSDGPNQCLHMDVVTVASRQASGSEYTSAVVIRDDFSRLVSIVPMKSQDAETVCMALLQWFSVHGVVRRLHSDQGSHFVNRVIERLCELMAVKHTFSPVYSPQANGKAERAIKEFSEMLRVLMLEARVNSEHWTMVVPLVQYMMNNLPSGVLGGLAPITVHTGATPTTTLDVIFKPAEGELVRVPVTKAAIVARVEAIRAALESARVTVLSERKGKRGPKGAQPVDFTVGDYVMVRALGGDDRVKNVLRPRWYGPATVVEQVNELVYRVREWNSDREREVHAMYVKRYCDGEVTPTQQMKEFAAYGGTGYPIDAVIGHRWEGEELWLKVLWEGLPDDWTWEPAVRVYADESTVVNAYTRWIEDPAERVRVRDRVASFRVRGSGRTH